MQSDLIAALASCAEESLRLKARDFLLGLSRDELEFIAEFLGASILESGRSSYCSRAQLALQIAEFQRARSPVAHEAPADRDHKMIVLLEFLCRSGIQRTAVPVSVARA